MSDELETMQSEPIKNEPVQPEAPAESAVEAEHVEAPVKKRRGRPPKKRVDAEAEGAPAEAVAEPESEPAAKQPVSASKTVARNARASEPELDFGDDGDYDPASVQHVESFTPGSRDGLKVVRTYKFNLDDDDDMDGDSSSEQDFPGGIRPNDIVVAGMNETGGATVDLPPDDDNLVYVPPAPVQKPFARDANREAPMPDFPDDDDMETRDLNEQTPAGPRPQQDASASAPQQEQSARPAMQQQNRNNNQQGQQGFQQRGGHGQNQQNNQNQQNQRNGKHNRQFNNQNQQNNNRQFNNQNQQQFRKQNNQQNNQQNQKRRFQPGGGNGGYNGMRQGGDDPTYAEIRRLMKMTQQNYNNGPRVEYDENGEPIPVPTLNISELQ